MTKSWKCFIILLVGSLFLLLASALIEARREMSPFVGSLIPLAVIVSAIIGAKEKPSRKVGFGILFWGGIAAFFIHTLMYTEPGAIHPENWGIDIACFIQGAILALLIYHLKADKIVKAGRPHRDMLRARF